MAGRGKPAVLLIAAGAIFLGSATLAAPPGAHAAVDADRAGALGKQAYDYGLPLLEFLRIRREQTSVRCPDGRGNAPVNSFSNARGFATAADRTVVAPNTDTLYSLAHLDLARGPIVLSHPNMGKRYYSFELVDPYTNVIDIPGVREDGRRAGSFVISWKRGKPKGGAAQPKADPTPAPAVADAPSADQPKGPVRTVGPPFVASH